MINTAPTPAFRNSIPLFNPIIGTGGNPKVPCDKCGSTSHSHFIQSGIKIKNGVTLSPSEMEVFKRVMLADKVIADQLFISVETVKKHFQNIRRKTGLSNKIEIAIWATQTVIYNGYIN
ncbi:helix-turn-helix transcriptional regulator [Mucilaginibacter gossypii]|uniref:response regulator transcription factor n=1 Tax=Mucilaginibacter gossypii TaxID=551996 RepID=UPI000DCCEC2B|nr:MULTISPECIES: helix-turn-helix transcriptional regulator [Mucilaginibacter]QTE37524.1 helix-turn-helix transcriptional regulator [Mucilaginibacter gossypii]RAV52350.1 hypothetical protein DIU36_24760 [Mucilaginibacter rubeus]